MTRPSSKQTKKKLTTNFPICIRRPILCESYLPDELTRPHIHITKTKDGDDVKLGAGRRWRFRRKRAYECLGLVLFTSNPRYGVGRKEGKWRPTNCARNPNVALIRMQLGIQRRARGRLYYSDRPL